MIPDWLVQGFDGPVYDEDELEDSDLFDDDTPLTPPEDLSPEAYHATMSRWDSRGEERVSVGDGLFTGLCCEYWNGPRQGAEHFIEVRCVEEDTSGVRTYLLCLTRWVANDHGIVDDTGWQQYFMVRTEDVRDLLRDLFLSFGEVKPYEHPAQ